MRKGTRPDTFTRALALAAGAAAALALGGCSPSVSEPSTVTPASTSATVSGVAMKGRFLAGQVCAFKLVGGAQGALLGCANINPATSGYTIPVSNYTGEVLLEISGSATHDDEANPADNVAGTPIPNGALRSVAVVSNGAVTQVAITPFTEAALRAATSLSYSAALAAATQLRNNLGIASSVNLFTTVPAVTPSTAGELVYREALRAFSQMNANHTTLAGNLQGFLDHLANNQATLLSTFQTELNTGLATGCSITGNTLECTVGGGGGGGGGDGPTVCLGIACGAPTSPGGVTPTLPAVLPTPIQLPTGSNPGSQVAAAWNASKPAIKSAVWAPSTPLYSTIEVQYAAGGDMPRKVVSRDYGSQYGQQGTRTWSFGPDDLPRTADDVLTELEFRYYNADGSSNLYTTFSGAGADGIWRTADDVAHPSARIVGVHGADNNGHHIIVPELGVGDDRLFFTTDDIAHDGYEFVTLNENGYGVRSVYYGN